MEENVLPPVFRHLPVHSWLHYCRGHPPGHLQGRPEASDSECRPHIHRVRRGLGLRAQLSNLVAGAGLPPEFTKETPPQCCLQAAQAEERGVHESKRSVAVGAAGL